MTKTSEIERLFRAHYAAMHRLAMLILRDEDVARDIVHDVFESLLTTGGADVSGSYLLRAVRNRCLNHLRGISVSERFCAIYPFDEKEIDDEDWPDDDTIALIHSTIANDLSDSCRRVVGMRFSEGMRYREIADALDISEVAVYKHLRHAIDVLRQKFSQNG